jgi:hypothetical protein
MPFIVFRRQNGSEIHLVILLSAVATSLHHLKKTLQSDLEAERLFTALAARCKRPTGAEESTEAPTVGPYRAGEGRFTTGLILTSRTPKSA